MQNKSLIYNRMTRQEGSNSNMSKVERIFGNDQIKVKAIQKDEVGKEAIRRSLLRRKTTGTIKSQQEPPGKCGIKVPN
jgi:hypothetical protein